MISFKNVNKWYGDLHVLNKIDLEVAQGEVVVVCGPSGSGKSTLIRCINRLEPIQEGELIVDGMMVHDKKTNMTKVRAEIGFVFQSFNLYPHMTALENSAWPSHEDCACSPKSCFLTSPHRPWTRR
jgi:polar amino acid transport system ATP-binding protein